jgi:hypothetical protein
MPSASPILKPAAPQRMNSMCSFGLSYIAYPITSAEKLGVFCFDFSTSYIDGIVGWYSHIPNSKSLQSEE